MNPTSSDFSKGATLSSTKSSAPKKNGIVAGPSDKVEKTNKKVSRACNTCRLKRKKCDGLDPCHFCTETKVECSYSREPRRRGPPSGYLRYTETRVTLLETLLGILCLSYSASDNITSTLLSLTLTLQTESKTCTQDVWDRYKAAWLATQAAGVIEELALGFAPFSHNRGEGTAAGEGYAKPLLPTTASGSSSNANEHDGAQNKDEQASPEPLSPRPRPFDLPPPGPQSHSEPSPRSVSFSMPSPAQLRSQSPPFSPGMLSRESFERTRSTGHSEMVVDRSGPSSRTLDRDQEMNNVDGPSPSNMSYPLYMHPPSASKLISTPYTDAYDSHPRPMKGLGVNPVQLGTNLGEIMHSAADSSYTGSYWRTAELALEGLPLFEVMQDPPLLQSTPSTSNANWNPHSTTTTALPPSTSNDSTSQISGGTNLLSSLLASSASTSTSSKPVDLPPPHILASLVDTYYTHVHPTLPILPDSTVIQSMLHGAGSGNGALAGTALGNLGSGESPGLGLGDATTCMLLAMCAYVGRLSPGMDASAHDSGSIPSTPGITGVETPNVFGGIASILGGTASAGLGSFLGSDASKIAADLWYEQARGAVNALLRKPARLETVQALILLALRDYGKGGVGAGGGESQAWLLVGMAVRLGQELDLSGSVSFSPNFSSPNLPTNHNANPSLKLKAKHSTADHVVRGNLWATATMLDCFLSLQLGRTPAVSETLKPTLNATTCATVGLTVANPSIFSNPSVSSPPPLLFAYSYSLSQIISKINFWLYLGFGPTSSSPCTSDAQAQHYPVGNSATTAVSTVSSGTVTPNGENSLSTQAKLTVLRADLDCWLQALPMQFRISIGGMGFGGMSLGTKEVLEINMLYHVAVILLYKPFIKDHTVQHAVDVFLDAASTFNLLLEKYKNQHTASSAGGSTGAPALVLSNPHLIYLIFTASLAHLSGFRFRQQQARASANHQQLSSPQRRVASPYQRNLHSTSYSPSSAHMHTPSYPSRPHSSPSASSSSATSSQLQTQQLQTQLHLLNCLEALKTIGKTWELARRCWRTLDQLMDKEGMKPGGAGPRERDVAPPADTHAMVHLESPELGKRKRDWEDSKMAPVGPPGFRGEGVRLRSLSGSASSPESATLVETPGPSESHSVAGLYGSDGSPIPVARSSDASGMMDWTKTGSEHSQMPNAVFPGQGFSMPFLSSGWLSEFEADLSDASPGSVFDVGGMDVGGGGWGLPGLDSWNGWDGIEWNADSGGAAWDERLWGKEGAVLGLDAG